MAARYLDIITIIRNKNFPVLLSFSKSHLKVPLSFQNANNFICKWDELKQIKQNGIDVCSQWDIHLERKNWNLAIP